MYNYIYLETQEPIKKKVVKNNQVFSGITRFCPIHKFHIPCYPHLIYAHDAEADVFHHRHRDRQQVVASWQKMGTTFHIRHITSHYIYLYT